MNKPLVDAIVHRTADPASVAWAHEGAGALASLPDPLAAIAAAEKLGNAAALQAVTAPKELKKAAAVALHKLRSRGVKFEAATAAPVAFVLGRETIEVPSRAFLSVPDMEGDLELLLTCTDGEGTCALGIIVAGDASVRESRHAHLNRGQLRDTWKQAEGRRDLAELPFEVGLNLAEGWLAPSRDHGWQHFLEHVPAGTLARARLLDPRERAPAGEDDGAGAASWMAPITMMDDAVLKSAVEGAVAVMRRPDAEGVEATSDALEALIHDTADAVLSETARVRMASSARLAALSWRWQGKGTSADRLESLAETLGAAAGRDVPQIVAGVRIAVLSNLAQAMQDAGMTPRVG